MFHSDDAFLLLTSQQGERFGVIKESIKSLHPLLYAGGNIPTKDEGKAEILNAFFASVFSSWTILRVLSPLSWKTEVRSRKKSP